MIKQIVFTALLVVIYMLLPITAYAQIPANYETKIMIYEHNSITVQFPKITGMKDRRKQKEINYLLEREVFQYVNDLLNQGKSNKLPLSQVLTNISNETYIEYRFLCEVAFQTNDLISISYRVIHDEPHGPHPYSWQIAYTVDIRKEKIIGLNDLVTDMESLLTLDIDGISYIDNLNRFNFKKDITTSIEHLTDNVTDFWYIKDNKNNEFFDDKQIYLALTYWVGRFHETFSIPIKYIETILDPEYLYLLEF